MMRFVKLLVVLLLMFQLCGCFLTKIVSVPMRVSGAAISIIPGVGNTADEAIDKAADIVDEIPI